MSRLQADQHLRRESWKSKYVEESDLTRTWEHGMQKGGIPQGIWTHRHPDPQFNDVGLEDRWGDAEHKMKMAPGAGNDPATYRLTVGRSTTERYGHIYT